MRVTITVLLLMFALAYSKAQIIYTDVTPDAKYSCSQSGCTQTYNLDLNNDGINDFTISDVTNYPRCSNGMNSYLSITQLDSNEAVGYNNALKLPVDTIINEQSVYITIPGSVLTLESFGYLFIEHGGCYLIQYGTWPSSKDGYIGLKLNKAGLIYYGWARLSVSVSSKSSGFIIKDYAYNSVSNKPILSGEKSCTSPSVTLSANGPLSFCVGDSVILTANGTGYLYQWKKNGGNIKGATSKKYVVKIAGIYTCKVTNSCGSKISKADTIQISCKEALGYAAVLQEKINTQAEQLNVAPNPFSNITSINYMLPQKFVTAQIIITDKTGKTVKAVNISGSGRGSLRVDASTLAAGAYEYSLVIDGRLIATKQMEHIH